MYQDSMEFKKEMSEYYVDKFEDFRRQVQKRFPDLDFSSFKLGKDVGPIVVDDKKVGDSEEMSSLPLIDEGGIGFDLCQRPS